MSDNQDSQNDDIPTQESATNTSNQDTKISYDPNGERYIRTTEEESPLIATNHLSERP